MTSPRSRTILFVRLPGLLAQAAKTSRGDTNALSPLVVSEGRLVRDACLLALAQGVRVGMSVVQARRLCLTLMAVPLEQVDASALRRHFLNTLVNLSPVVEPDGLDAAYVDMTGDSSSGLLQKVQDELHSAFCPVPIVGLSISRLAARACAESGVINLENASIDFLWPDDPAVIARMKRLGLSTFGAVAAVSEESLRLHFGKIAPLLHRRAHGIDLTPIRTLYPPQAVEVWQRFDDAVGDKTWLDNVLAQMSKEAETQLRRLGGYGRRVTLSLQTEHGEHRQEWVVPSTVSTAEDVRLAVARLLTQMRLTAPVMAISIDVADISPPAARTPDLFCAGPGSDPVALEAVRRRLAARFGLTTLTIPAQWPRTARQKRRTALSEQWRGVRAVARSTSMTGAKE